MTGPISLDISSRARSSAGCIVTLREQRSGRQQARHLPGGIYQSLRELAVNLDRLNEQDEDWRVSTISTPSTIYRDLHGTRAQVTDDKQRRDQSVEDVEHYYLGRIGRLDLLEPPHRRVDASSRALPLSRRQQQHGSAGGE